MVCIYHSFSTIGHVGPPRHGLHRFNRYFSDAPRLATVRFLLREILTTKTIQEPIVASHHPRLGGPA